MPCRYARVDGRLRRLRRVLRAEDGFGLVELLVAMVILNVGLLAILAAFVSGSTTLRRASRVATASTVADTQMELYRALTYTAIHLDQTQLAAADTTYRCDSALGTSCPNTINSCPDGSTCADGSVPVVDPCADTQCLPTRDNVPGPDHGSYRIDTYIVYRTPAQGRQVKLVTVVVHDERDSTGPALARQTSSFDESTGQ